MSQIHVTGAYLEIEGSEVGRVGMVDKGVGPSIAGSRLFPVTECERAVGAGRTMGGFCTLGPGGQLRCTMPSFPFHTLDSLSFSLCSG